MFNNRVKEFLLFGGSEKRSKICDSHPENGVREIRDEAQEILAEWHEFSQRDADLLQTLRSELSVIEAMRNRVDSSELQSLVRRFAELRSKIQLLELAKTLDELSRFTNVENIPRLVLGVLDSVPKHLPNESRIRKTMFETVKDVRTRLLRDFHVAFEGHLQENNEDEDAKMMWSKFLQSSRVWLLAFALVSLLPAVITESRGLVTEKYAESLDEAMTPLWGRFHFHLSAARESKSLDQLIWTFSYAKSIVTLMVDLCTQITSSGHLQHMCAGDYQTAAMNLITDKASRFMRAHLAQAIVDNSPMTQELVVQLVEHTLDLDVALSASEYPPPLTVSAVLYDARAIHAQWVDADRRFFYEELKKLCENSDKVYSLSFSGSGDSSIIIDDEIVDATIPPMERIDSTEPNNHNRNTIRLRLSVSSQSHKYLPQMRCYSALLDCLHLLSTACERYKFMPAGSQDIFAGAVIEPIICIAVALFLYRIRADPVLRSISDGGAGFESAVRDKYYRSYRYGDDGNLSSAELPEVAKEFIDSAHYFQLCLGHLTKEARDRSANKARFDELWTDIITWMPRGSPALTTDASQDYVPLRLVEHTMSRTESSLSVSQSTAAASSTTSGATTTSSTTGPSNSGRGLLGARLGAIGSSSSSSKKSTGNSSSSSSKNNYSNPEDNKLGGLIDVSRAQVITIAKLIESQWAEIIDKM